MQQRMNWKKTNGFIAATFTPMHENGSVNTAMIEPYVQHLLNVGIKQVFVNGTSGESLSLTVEERKAIAEAWIKHGRGKLDLIIVHCGAGSLVDTKELVKHACGIRADCVAVVAPTYYKPRNVEELVDYLAEVAKEAPNTPFLYYHIPVQTGINTKIVEFFRIAYNKIPTLVGVKFTSADLHDAASAAALFDGKYDVIMGSDGTMLAAMSMGIQSFIGITFSVVGKICDRLKKAFDKGDLTTARKEQMSIVQFMNISHNVGDTIDCLASIKALVSEYFAQLKLGPPRKPVVGLSKKRIEEVKANLGKINFQSAI